MTATLKGAFVRHQAGDLDGAENLYRDVLAEQPGNPAALQLLGVLLSQKGETGEAERYLHEAIRINPGYADAYSNLGNVLTTRGAANEAVAAYRRAIKLNPDLADAHNNLGRVLLDLGQPDEAVRALVEAARLKPGVAEIHVNLANAFLAVGRVDEAAAAGNDAVRRNPNYAKAHNSLGNVYAAERRSNKAIACFQQAVTLDANYAQAHNNLGTVLLQEGEFAAAIASFDRAASLQPENNEILSNLVLTHSYYGDLTVAFDAWVRLLENDADIAEPYLAMSQFMAVVSHRELAGASLWTSKLRSRFEVVKSRATDAACSGALEYLPRALERDGALPAYRSARQLSQGVEADTVYFAGTGALPAASTPAKMFPEKIVALLNFGRSGSGFIHSLIEGHSQVTTLPGTYFAGFFGRGVWEQIKSDEPARLVHRFSSMYEVLFDASNPKGVPGDPTGWGRNLGESEGFTCMGETGKEVLRLGKSKFKTALKDNLRGCRSINQGDFFRHVHVAYEACQGKSTDRDTVFYHIHNPNFFEFTNFLNYFPDTKLLMIVREPLQSCESWVSKSYNGPGDYAMVVNHVVNLLFQIDRVEFEEQDSVGVKLEDLKNDPRRAMRALCDWMEISEEDSLFESTMQGLKWRGDPSSALFNRDDPFDKEAIGRPVGSIFSERDQFILRTLFYPFRQLFGYAENDQQGFERDLAEIEPMIHEPFDFETNLFAKAPGNNGDPTRFGISEYLRAAVSARWRLLSEKRTYPNMISPLTFD